MKEYLGQTFSYENLNKILFSIFFSLEIINIVVSIIILQQNPNSFINEQNLPFILLIFISLGLGIGHRIYEIILNKQLKNYNLEDQYLSIIYVEILFQLYQTIKINKCTQSYFKLYNLIKNQHQQYFLSFQQEYNLKQLKSDIFRFIHNKLETFQESHIQRYEQLMLFFVGYLVNVFNKPLLGLVELKKYEILMNDEQSYFLKIMKPNIQNYLQIEIQRTQTNSLKKFNGLQIQMDRQLQQQEVQQTLLLQQEVLPLINQILDHKIHLMNQQIVGLQNIYIYYKLALIQSDKMKILEDKLQNTLNIDMDKLDHNSFTLNVIQLKLLSVFFSAIMNDYYSTLVCEKTIEEILNIDHTISNDIISNSKLINNKVVLVQISMIKDRGLILNKDKQQLAIYFDYDLKYFEQIKNIKEIMPTFFSIHHDQLLLQYLQTARSIYVEKFNQIFSIDNQGFLISQQLKIDNDFSITNDYVLIGCVNELKSQYDYILFQEDGKLIGMTKSIYDIIVQNSIKDFNIQYLIDYSYVFMYFQQLIELINEYKQSLKSNYSQTQETTTILMCSDRLQNIIEKYNKQYLPFIKTMQNERINSLRTQTIQRNKSQIESSNLNDFQDNIDGNTQNEQDSIQLYDVQYQERILNFIQTEIKQELIEYYVKVSINRRVIEFQNKSKGYFIMEITDIRKKLQNTTTMDSSALLNQPQTLSAYKSSIIPESSSIDNSFNIIPIKEYTPNMIADNTYIASLLSKISPRSPIYNQGEDQSMAFESVRESFQQGPLSQKVNFISPSFVKQQQGILEKDMNDLQQLEIEFNNYSKQNEECQDVDQEGDSKNIDMAHDSSNNKQQSNNVLEVFKLNKTYKEQHIEADQDIQKSKSSQTSRTSGVSAIQIIKKFQRQEHMQPNLKIILFQNILLTIVIIVYIIIQSIIIQNQENYTITKVEDLRSPMLIIRYYLKLFSLSWTLILTALGITSSSSYLTTQNLVELAGVRELIYSDLDQYYDNFVILQESGQIPVVEMLLRGNQVFDSDFLVFYDFMQNLAESMFVNLDITEETLTNIINNDFFNQIILLRLNMKPLVLVGEQIIDAISLQFYNLLDSKIQNIEILIIVEIIVFTVILYIQIYFWKLVQEYIQQIILIAGRLSEIQQKDCILKLISVKESLDKTIGKQAWTKKNFYQTAYLSQTQEDGQLQSAIKLLKLEQQQNNISRQTKKSVNTVLNYRFQNTKISILKETLLITTIMCFINIYIVGLYILYKNQMNDLLPTQDLSVQYINFLTDLDVIICYSYIIKTQPLIMEYFKNNNYQDYYNDFVNKTYAVTEFNNIEPDYDSELSDIFQAIQNSNQISNSDQQKLDLLYQSDFCQVVPDDIPFCHYKELTFNEFSKKYGQPDTIDDNREYLSKGLMGIVSNLDSLYKQSFDYEITYDDYSTDLQSLSDILNNKEFNNAIAEHFIDTSIGTTEFFNIIEKNEQNIMLDDLNQTLIYIYTLGGILVSFYFILYLIWIIKTHRELKLIRLILTNLPIEILTEQHTLSQIKRLS